jgi:hypothetical protein
MVMIKVRIRLVIRPDGLKMLNESSRRTRASCAIQVIELKTWVELASPKLPVDKPFLDLTFKTA